MASARLMPIALTLMRTSFGPGAGTWTSTNSRTSGPPAFANLIERDMAVSAKTDGVEEFDVRRTCRMFLPPTGYAGAGPRPENGCLDAKVLRRQRASR